MEIKIVPSSVEETNQLQRRVKKYKRQSDGDVGRDSIDGRDAKDGPIKLYTEALLPGAIENCLI